MVNDPTAFQIQREIVEEGKSIDKTAAGEVVSEQINKLIKHHEAEMVSLREELRRALDSRDELTRADLDGATRELQEQMEKMKAESEAMVSRFNEEKRKMDEMIDQMKREDRQGRKLFNGDWLAHMAWHIARICQQADGLRRRLRNGDK